MLSIHPQAGTTPAVRQEIARWPEHSCYRDLETLLKGFNQAYTMRLHRVLKGAPPEQVVQRCVAAEPKLANLRSKPPDPHALSNALKVVATAKEVSHPDS